MKWDCGPDWRERRDRARQWHRWFAWHPVRIGSHDCRWLEYVERRDETYDGECLIWEYR